jgi:serine/threonine protein kinase
MHYISLKFVFRDVSRRLFVFRDFSKPHLVAYEKKLKEQKQRLSPWMLEQKLDEKEAELLGEFQKYWKPYVTTPEEWEREGCAIKIIDFGLSCITSSRSTGCAHHGAGQGTPAIMSKEQFLAAQAGHKANQNMDIWALGLNLYYLLFGTIPHIDSAGRLDRGAVVQDNFDVFQSAPWYWILYKTMSPHWKEAAAVLKVTMTSVRQRYTAKQIWDEMEYIAEYKRLAMAADQREKVSPRRNLPPSAGGVVEAEGNRKATGMDGVWEFFRIDWGSLWSKLGS